MRLGLARRAFRHDYTLMPGHEAKHLIPAPQRIATVTLLLSGPNARVKIINFEAIEGLKMPDAEWLFNWTGKHEVDLQILGPNPHARDIKTA
jgi:hypothetical protein